MNDEPDQFHIRNTTKGDFVSISRLMNLKGTKFFGSFKLLAFKGDSFLDFYSTHRLVVREREEDVDIVAYADFKTYPNIACLPRDSWLDWMKMHFCINLPLSFANTLFLQHFICKVNFTKDVFTAVLREIFYRESKVRYLVTVQPPEQFHENKKDIAEYTMYEKLGHVFYPKDFSVSRSNTCRVYVVERDHIIPKMRYRLALPEDNDDIVEVVDVDRPELRRDLGDYYIAEQLLANEPHKTLIVTEVHHTTVGFIWLNDDVNIRSLVKNFELESFGNLIKYSAQEPTQVLKFHITDMKRKNRSTLFSEEAIENLFDESYLGKFLLKAETSAFTLKSQFNMNVGSISCTSTESDEDSYLREEFLKKFEKLNEKLQSTAYYVTMTDRVLQVPHNVGPSGTDEFNSNVFALQLFGLTDSSDLRRMFRFLSASFCAYTDRDYCVFSLPASWKITPTLAFFLQYFIPVNPRLGSSISDTLFITHRSSIFGDIVVHHMQREDVDQIVMLVLYGVTDPNVRDTDFSILTAPKDIGAQPQEIEVLAVHQVLEEVLSNPFSEYKVLTIRVGNSTKPEEEKVMIGFVILRQFNQIHLLRKHYLLPQVDESVNFELGEVVLLHLNPLFRWQSDFVFREIARLSGFWNFFYFSPTRSDPPPLTNDLVTRMQPIEPKRTKKIDFTTLKIDFTTLKIDTKTSLETENTATTTTSETSHVQPLAQLDLDTDFYAVYQHNLRPTNFFEIHSQIVILGFNSVCRAFLRLLIFHWNKLDFSNSSMHCCVPVLNVVVVAPPGVIDAELDRDFVCSYCKARGVDRCWVDRPNGDEFVRDTTTRMNLDHWVKFVHGRTKRIDRTKKVVVLSNNCEIHYDHLLLMCETHFGLPRPQAFGDELPCNYQHVNNRLEKMLLYHKVQVLLNEMGRQEGTVRILVHGGHVSAFECIAFLLQHGVKGENITLAMPVPRPIDEQLELNNSYEDQNIEMILQEMIEDQGVTVHERLNFKQWSWCSDDRNIDSVVFTVARAEAARGEEMCLECDLFINYCEAVMSDTMRGVIRSAGITMLNRHIMIDKAFHTSDPNILAVGDCTSFVDTVNNQNVYVSPIETARKLVDVLINGVEADMIDVKFHEPVLFVAQLPLDYHMAKVTIPKTYLANHLCNEYTFPMITYHEGDFCRVRLNGHGIVEEIVCITKQDICFDFLKFFCGRHELLLNNLRARWFVRAFDSFLEFFQQPWTELIMHEHFEELREQNRAKILPTAQKIMNENSDLNRVERRDLLRLQLNDRGTNKALEQALIDYLRKYSTDFYEPLALPEDQPLRY